MNKRIALSTILLLFLSGVPGTFTQVHAEDEVYGPPNLLRTMKTPFSGTVIQKEMREKRKREQQLKVNRLSLGTISLSSAKPKRPIRRSLRKKLIPSRLYLPERMTIGKPAKFVLKGKGGSKIAIAMADRDSGATPVLGHDLRLGSDRKLVAVGKIPPTGVLELYIGTPIAGDLIGSQLYFEAALWTKDDMSDMELAETIRANSEVGKKNGVFIQGDIAKKRGIRIIPDTAIPLSQRRSSGVSLSSGQP